MLTNEVFWHPILSVRRQCELLEIDRSGLDDEPAREPAENLRLIDASTSHERQRPG